MFRQEFFISLFLNFLLFESGASGSNMGVESPSRWMQKPQSLSALPLGERVAADLKALYFRQRRVRWQNHTGGSRVLN